MHTLFALLLLALVRVALPQAIALPPAIQVEGVEHATSSLFFAANFRQGSVLLIDVATAFTVTIVPPAPNRLATGLSFRNGRLFVAGGNIAPNMLVYDVRTGRTIAACAAPSGALINDVTVDEHFAYFTDSFLGNIYVLSVRSLPRCHWSALQLPPPLFASVAPRLAANGIVRFASGVVVANTLLGSLFFTDLRTNSSQQMLPNQTVAGAGGLAIVRDKCGVSATLLVTQAPERVISVWRLRYTPTRVRARFVRNVSSSAWETPSNVAVGAGWLVVGDPQFHSFPLSAELPDDQQLNVLAFRLRTARTAPHFEQ
eukprot:TRINITY_DN63009_c0_g1_i1.p1 TRINITY_DN63009_c0_g1~~TRINITY_DN63009_c0_g1_i1.p1  ORF type:complete len:314 (+),score=69.85 TRINITY_DN63009_c0_g1_i1:189-1130(+)